MRRLGRRTQQHVATALDSGTRESNMSSRGPKDQSSKGRCWDRALRFLRAGITRKVIALCLSASEVSHLWILLIAEGILSRYLSFKRNCDNYLLSEHRITPHKVHEISNHFADRRRNQTQRFHNARAPETEHKAFRDRPRSRKSNVVMQYR